MDKNGIDTTSLLPLDTSVSDDLSTHSLMEQDLGGAVAKLAMKSSFESSSISRKLHEVEKDLEKALLELEEMKSMKNVFEKRIEMMKASAKTSREEYLKANEEIDILTMKVEELTTELNQSKLQATNSSSSEMVHSEIQALEEENIEIMKENKELRKELSKLKLQMEKASKITPVILPTSSSDTIGLQGEVGLGIDKDLKRKRPNDEEMVVSRENVMNGVIQQPGNMENNNGDGSIKGRRVRSKVISKHTMDAPAPAVEAPGECNQS